MLERATALGPERLQLGQDPLAELVAGVREREGCVRVQALEAAGPARAADAKVERRTLVAARAPRGQAAPDRTLLLLRSSQTVRQGGIRARRVASIRETAATSHGHVR